jgi:transcriptional regulator with XRE-family HTH domain
MNNRKKIKPLDPDDQMKNLGKRIRALRKAMGYTSAENFANDKGFPRATYSKYENGRNLEFITLVRLASAFGMTLKEFFSEGFDD